MLVYLGKKSSPTDYYVVEIQTDDDEVGGPISEDGVANQAYASGYIYGGTVTQIRKYVFNFTSLDFSFTNVSSYDIVDKSGPFEEKQTFEVGSPISLSRKYMKRGTSDVGPILSSFGDKNSVTDRQRQYFERPSLTSPQIVFETQDMTGSRQLIIYGSFERTLHELRQIILSREEVPSISAEARDSLVGTYYQYHPNGNLRRTYTYKNPTLTGDSLLHGDYYEYYEDGTNKVIGHFTDNFLNGLYKQFYSNGILQNNCVIINGKLEGQYNHYTIEGNREFIAFYVNGTLDNSYVLDYQL